MRLFIWIIFTLLLCACKENPRQYNGYIDADLSYLSSNYPGRLKNLCVHRGQAVQQGQLIFKLEQTEEKNAVKISELHQQSLVFQRQEILHQLHYAKTNQHRSQQMLRQNAASQNDLDLARRDENVLTDKLADIDTQLKSSQIDTRNKRWQVSRKENYANDNGIIYDTYFTPNEYIASGQAIASLITQKNIKVIFFVSETVLSQLRLNTKIRVFTDKEPHFAEGHIRYIAKIAQYTPPILYSREERQKLVFRIEASIDKPELDKIHLGQPISLEIL